jgi:hypothetical protein
MNEGKAALRLKVASGLLRKAEFANVAIRAVIQAAYSNTRPFRISNYFPGTLRFYLTNQFKCR